MSWLDKSKVFCISTNGIVEGHHFLTLVSCRPSLSCPLKKRRRSRTTSLPSYLEDSDLKDFLRLSLPSRCYSEEVFELPKAEASRDVCFKCVSSMIKLHDKKTSRKISAKVSLKHNKKCRAAPYNLNTRIRSSTSSVTATAIQKSSDTHHRKSLQCSGAMLQLDGYMLSYFISEIRRSQVFRTSFVRHWSNQASQTLTVFVAIMKDPQREVLDLLGNKMVTSNILYRRSLEHALSWLSTLGGAFSALGDLSPSWAEEAGHVSLTQLRIAMKLGDPRIQSRCRLYAAISLLQKGYLKSSRAIVLKEYKDATALPEDTDPRLRRMCLGVWAKLQYHWKKAHVEKKMLNATRDGLKDIQNNAKYWNVYDLEEGRKIMPYAEAS